jgi:hypothetical protein
MEIILIQDQRIQLLLTSAPAIATKVWEVFSICSVIHHYTLNKVTVLLWPVWGWGQH